MLQTRNLFKTYSSKNGVTHQALDDITLAFDNKGLVFILGKSGSGKSTLLNMLSGLDDFDRGDVLYKNKSFKDFTKDDFNYYRNTLTSFIFQDFNLIDSLNVIENITLSYDLQGKTDYSNIDPILKELDIYDLKNRNLNELSGGQKQRVAIARSIIKGPKIIFADEPTGALDIENSTETIKILKQLSLKKLVIVVTHNKELAYTFGDRIIEIKDGHVHKDLTRSDLCKNKDSIIEANKNLLIIPKGKKLDKKHIYFLNNTIAKKRKDYYILSETNKERAMSLFPHSKEIIANDNKSGFIPYHEEYVDNSNYESKYESSLSVSKALKIAKSSLKKKKGKLLFTLILSIISIIITGASLSFANYNLSDAISASVKKENGQYLEVISSFSISDSEYRLQESEINELKSLDKDLAYSYDRKMSYSSGSTKVDSNLKNDELFAKGTLSGLLVVDDIEKWGYKNNSFKVIYEKENIQESDYINGCYISSIIANAIYNNGKTVKGYTSIEDLVNTTFKVDKYSFNVLGIYDFDEDLSLYNYFKPLYEENNTDLSNEYTNAASSFLLKLVVKDSFIENYKSLVSSLTLRSVTKTYNDFREVTSDSLKRVSTINLENATFDWIDSSYSSLTDEQIQEKLANLSNNEIIIGKDLAKSIATQSYYSSTNEKLFNYLNEYNNSNKTLICQKSVSGSLSDVETYQAINNVKIIGICTSNTADSTYSKCIYSSNNFFDLVMDCYYRPNKVLVSMNKNDNYSKIVSSIYDKGFSIDNEFVPFFVKLANILLKYQKVINAFIVIWCLLVSILLYSFTKSTILEDRKEIGILKALGAGNKDIYKIYLIQAVIIASISLVFGVSGYYIIGLLINNIVSANFYTFYYPIFIFNIGIDVAVIFISLAIIFISFVIALRKMDEIKTIEVINSKG